MTVSIITVTYNAEAVLQATLDNVLGQTWKDIEYLIIDGGSKDRTLEIVERYRDRLAVVVSEPDKGLYDAMNKGLDRATGEYVCFMNAGDLFASPTALEEAMRGGGGADFIYGDAEVFTEEGRPMQWHKRTPDAEHLRAASFLRGMVVCHQAMLVRRTCAARYDLRWKIAGDIDWSIATLRNCRTKYYTHRPLARFLYGGLSNQRRKRALTERWQIGLERFGLLLTLWAHVLIGWEALWRGTVSYKPLPVKN
jgi:glycosyltransferase involved in cell wall biosynthesis